MKKREKKKGERVNEERRGEGKKANRRISKEQRRRV